MEEKIIVNIEETIRNMFKDYFTSKVSNVSVSNGKLQVQRYDDSDFDDNTLFVDDCTETDISLKYDPNGYVISEYEIYQEFNTIRCIAPSGDGNLELKDFTISSDVDWIMTFDLLHTNREACGGIGIYNVLDIFSIGDIGDGVRCDISSNIYEWNSFKIVKNNSTYSVFVNDNLVGSTVNTRTGELKFNILGVGFDSVEYYIKDIKIKKFNMQEYDITTEEEETFTEVTVNQYFKYGYNRHYGYVVVSQLSNAGSSNLPTTYTYNIPNDYAPRITQNMPVYSMTSSGEPYGYIRINSSGVCELIVTKQTYNTSGGTTIYAGLFYPRK